MSISKDNSCMLIVCKPEADTAMAILLNINRQIYFGTALFSLENPYCELSMQRMYFRGKAY